MNPDLTITTQHRLDELEIIIERGLKAFYEVGMALAEIRDRKLYKAEYRTFEEYCERRWGLKKSHAYRTIDAAAVVQNVSNSTKSPQKVPNWGQNLEANPPVPMNEAQARPLTKLKPEQQREAWEKAVASAPSGKITAAHVKKVVKQVYDEQFQKSQVENPPQFPPPQVGDRVTIHLRNRNEPDLTPYNNQFAIVKQITPKGYVVVKVWDKVLPPLFTDEVRPAPTNVNVNVSLPAELLAAWIEAGYSSVDEAIAALAAQTTPSQSSQPDLDAPLAPGNRVRVKRGHPQEGKTGHIDYFTNPSSAIVELEDGSREMIGRSQLVRC